VLIGTGGTVLAATISVSYNTQKAIPTGTLVAIDGQNNGAVVPADDTTNNNILGVVVDKGTASVSSGPAAQQVEVSSKGVAYALVSNINGAIGKGTPVTSSPLEGIGMAATQDGRIIGIAQSDLNEQSLDAQYQTIKNKKGEDRRVLIGLVPVALDVTFYQQASSQASSVPKFLRDVSLAISCFDHCDGTLVRRCSQFNWSHWS
jgi:hypothetical protein